MDGLRGELGPYLTPAVFGKEMRYKYLARKASVFYLEGADEVKFQKGKVNKVVPRQRLAPKVGVYQAKPAKPRPARPVAGEVGNHDHRIVAHDDELDAPPPIDDRADLPLYLDGELGQGACELWGYDPVFRDVTAIQIFEPLYLISLEAVGVAVKLRPFFLYA